MPKVITLAQEIAYLSALADTGNATLAALHAGVSRDWAYKKREVDRAFAELCGIALAAAKAHLQARVNRDRADGWTAEREERFVERLGETCSVWLAARAVGLSTQSAYRRRQVRPGFAAAWDEAERTGWPPMDQPWIAAAIAFLEGEEAPDNPVRFRSVGEVLQAMNGNLFVPRRRGRTGRR